MREETDPAAMLGQAEQAQVRIRRAGRWYPAMMAAYGLFTIGIVAWIPSLHGSLSGIVFGLVAVVWVALMSWWKARHPVRPTIRRDSVRWALAWTVLLGCQAGCGSGGGGSAAALSEETARQALESALTAWKNGQAPDSLAEATPAVKVVDSSWKGGQKLEGYEILKSEVARWGDVVKSANIKIEQ